MIATDENLVIITGSFQGNLRCLHPDDYKERSLEIGDVFMAMPGRDTCHSFSPTESCGHIRDMDKYNSRMQR